MRLKNRGQPDVVRIVIAQSMALLLAILLGTGLFLSIGKSPLEAYRAMVCGAFGSWYGLSESLVRMLPLGLCALGIGLAARMGLWNIGAEGQLLTGALAASWVALFAEIGAGWRLWAMILAGTGAGVLWASLASALRNRFGVSEILSTLMLNYVAEAWVDHLVYGSWKGPDGFPYTVSFPDSAQLPALSGSRVHLGLISLPLLAWLLHVMINHTRLGFEIRLSGDSPSASDYAGVPARRNVFLVMAVAGGLAGLAGVLEVAGLQHRLQPGISPGFGYTAIIVAWLARCHMLGTVIVAFFFGGLVVAGDELSMALRIPQSAVVVFQSLLFISVLGARFFEHHHFEGESRT